MSLVSYRTQAKSSTGGTRDARGISDTVARVVDGIDDMIGAGVLTPGQRLVESDIMERLNAGRAPVREALRILAGDGVIELANGKSARVRALSHKRLLDMMEFITHLHEASIKILFDRGITAEVKRSLLEKIKSAENTLKTGTMYAIIQSLIEYNETIILFCENEYLSEVWSRFHVQLYSRQLASLVTMADVVIVLGQFRVMNEKIANGDLSGALEANWQLSQPFMQAAG